MKGKTKFVLGMVVGIIVGVLIACGVYYLTVGKVEWEEYIKNDLIPNAVTVLTAVGTICVAAIPVANKIIKAASKFNSATHDVKETVKNNSKNEDRIANLETSINRIESVAANTEQIVRLGFCNTDELVKKGYAVEIAKVGQNGANNGESEEEAKA